MCVRIKVKYTCPCTKTFTAQICENKMQNKRCIGTTWRNSEPGSPYEANKCSVSLCYNIKQSWETYCTSDVNNTSDNDDNNN